MAGVGHRTNQRNLGEKSGMAEPGGLGFYVDTILRMKNKNTKKLQC